MALRGVPEQGFKVPQIQLRPGMIGLVLLIIIGGAAAYSATHQIDPEEVGLVLQREHQAATDHVPQLAIGLPPVPSLAEYL